MDDTRHTNGVSDDDKGDMFRRDRLDERTADAVLDGRDVNSADPGVEDLVAFAAALREAGVATPRPSDELAEALATGLVGPPVTEGAPRPAAAASHRRRPVFQTITAKLAALTLAAKVGLGATAVLAATTTGAALGALPQPAQDGVANAVGVVTPFEFPTSASEEADFGLGVAEEATADSENPGVDGCEIAIRALEDKAAEDAEDAAAKVEEHCGTDAETPEFGSTTAEDAGEDGRSIADDRRGGTPAGSDGIDGPPDSLPDSVPDTIPPVTPPNGE